MKRLVAGVLWTFAIWYLSAAISLAFGAPYELGPIVGVFAGVLVAIDPRGWIWSRSTATQA